MRKARYYAGLDQHNRTSRVIVIDAQENLKANLVIHHKDHDQIGKELKKAIPKGSLVCLEATGFWYWMNDLLEDLGYETILAHAAEVAEIAKSKKKNDTRDAFILAKLGKDGRLHRAYKMPRQVRPLRDLLRHRMTLVSQRTSCKNQIHAILHKHGIWHGYSDLFGSRGEEFLKDLDLPDPVRHMVENYWQIIEELKARIAGTQALIRKEIPEDELIGLLMTIPGIGPLLSRVIRYELWDIDRFESFKKLMSYVGTAPATWQSAESVSHGGITRQGNTYVRWAIVEAAQHVKRARDPYLLWKYTRLSKRRGRMKARMAVACDILQAVYFVWKRREPFRPKPAPKSFIRLVRVKKKRRASNQ